MNDNHILGNYEIIEDNILKEVNLNNAPLLMYTEKDGESFLIKYWPRNSSTEDHILENIWQHELRQLQRLKGYPGVGDYIVYPVEAQKNKKGFYLVLNSEGRFPLSFFTKRTTLSLPKNSHWLTRLKEPTKRIRFWKNIFRVTNAIALLHAQGLLHRHLDENSILTYEYASDDYNDFQLTGFEWSIRMPTLTSSKINTSTNIGKLSTFAADWRDLGILISRLLKIDLDKLKDLSNTVDYFVDKHNLTISEVSLIRSLIGILPIKQNAIKELLTEKEVLNAISSIIKEINEFYNKSGKIHGIAINTKHEQTNNNNTSKKDLFYCIQKKIHETNKITISREDSEIINTFISNDLSDSPALFTATKNVGGEKIREVILKGKELCYVLAPFQVDTRSGEKSWALAYCQQAFFELPEKFYNKDNFIEIDHNNINCYSLIEARIFLRSDQNSLKLVSWEQCFDEIGKDKNERNKEHLHLLEGLSTVHIANIAYAKAEIFPVSHISHESEPDSLSSWIFKFSPRHDELSEGLSKSLGIDSPSVRLESIINGDDKNDKLSWSLVNNRDFNKSEDEISLEFYGYDTDDKKQDIYSFVSKKPFPDWKQLFIVPDSLEGTLRQITRHANTLDMLENHAELMNVLTSPQSQLTKISEEIKADDIISGLDDSKKSVFNKVLSTIPINLVQGPPGVGKTHLVKALSQYIFDDESNSRILFTAQSHATVQHLYHEVTRELKGCDDESDAPIIIRCNKISGDDDSVQNAADDSGVEYLKRFLSSKLFLESSNYKLKSEISNLLNSPPAKRYPIVNQLIKAANLIFATTNSDHVERMIKERAQFDWSIMEESGKITGIELISPLLLSHRRLMIGDHNQLPPYRSTELKNILVNSKKLVNTIDEIDSINNYKLKNELIRNGHFTNMSEDEIKQIGLRSARLINLFESLIKDDEEEEINYKKLHGKDATRQKVLSSMLSVQHRMHPYIAEIISDVFYGRKLLTDITREKFYNDNPFDDLIKIQSNSFLYNSSPIVWINTPDVQKTKGYRSSDHRPVWTNEFESQVLTSVLKDLDKNTQPIRTVKLAILSPYANQVKLISKKIDIERKNNGLSNIFNKYMPPDDHDKHCLTVDSFQGGEADLVIISLVRNNGKSTIKSALGFLSDQRRINVLLSRAKYKLIIIGSYDFLISWSSRISKGSMDDYEFLPKLTNKISELNKDGKLSFIDHSIFPDAIRSFKNGK